MADTTQGFSPLNPIQVAFIVELVEHSETKNVMYTQMQYEIGVRNL
jgi:hypothetical protein